MPARNRRWLLTGHSCTSESLRFLMLRLLHTTSHPTPFWQGLTHQHVNSVWQMPTHCPTIHSLGKLNQRNKSTNALLVVYAHHTEVFTPKVDFVLEAVRRTRCHNLDVRFTDTMTCLATRALLPCAAEEDCPDPSLIYVDEQRT